MTGMPEPKAAGSAESFQTSGLSPGTAYYFLLRAVDNKGNVSPPSNSVSTLTTPYIVTFSDNFEAGGGNWTVEGSDGVGGRNFFSGTTRTVILDCPLFPVTSLIVP